MADGQATDLHLPLLTLVADMPGVVQTLPVLRVITIGTAATLPMLTTSADGVTVINVVDADLPLLTASGSGFTGLSGAVSIQLPLFTIFAGTGPEAALTFPSLVISATGKTGFVGTLAQALPLLSATGEILPAGFSSGSSSLPLFSISASGVVHAIGSIALTFRALQITGSGFAGTTSSLSAALPVPTLTLIGYGAYTLTAALRLPALVTSGGVLVPTTAQTFRTWVLNTRKKGLTEYDFEFNSYATFRGMVLAADATGLFKLDGADADATASIVALVRTGKDDFGTSMNKRVPRIYVGVEARADLEFSTITTSGGKRTYLLVGNDVTGIQQRRVPIGRGPKSPYWQFELTNPRGEDFLLEHFTLRPEKSARRVI